MNYLGQLFSSAKKYYQNINAATLTGAIDVIVIEQENGDYKSTPFYVRFGKIGVLCPQTHSVEVCINGKQVPDLRMYIELTGDAFFETTRSILPNDKCAIRDSIESPEAQVQEDEYALIKPSENDENSGEIRQDQEPTIPCLSVSNELREDAAQLDPVANENAINLDTKFTLRNLLDIVENLNGSLSHFRLYLLTHKHPIDSPVREINEQHKIPSSDVPCANGSLLESNGQILKSDTDQDHKSENQVNLLDQSNPTVVRYDKPDWDCHPVNLDENVDELLQTPIDQLESMWCVWSGQCMPLQTAAHWLINNPTQTQRDQYIKSISSTTEYQIVQTTNHCLHDADSGFGQTSSGRQSPELTPKHDQDHDPGQDELKSSSSSSCVKSRGFWSWWRRTPNSQPQTNEGQPHVQKVLPPIDLIVSSPDGSSDEEHGPNQDTSLQTRWFTSKTDELLEPPTSPKPAHSSTSDLTKDVPSPDTETQPLHDDRGYLSDQESRETINHTTLRLSKHVEKRISCQGTRELGSDQLKRLNLHSGPNEAVFTVITKYQGTCQCACFIYLWKWTDKIVVSDIDGTITKSDWLGHLMPLVGCDWTHPHIVQLYDRVARNGYRLIYVSSRPIGQARSTRKLLRSAQHNNYHLPDGPILLYPFSAIEAFHKEVILRRADEYKIKCLLQVCKLFETGDSPKNPDYDPYPLVAGFGNRPTDVNTYKTIGLKNHQIFTVNYQGQVIQGDPQFGQTTKKSKAEKQVNQETLERNPDEASRQPLDDTLITLNSESLLQMADAYFPQLRDRMIYASNYSDYTFWRTSWTN